MKAPLVGDHPRVGGGDTSNVNVAFRRVVKKGFGDLQSFDSPFKMFGEIDGERAFEWLLRRRVVGGRRPRKVKIKWVLKLLKLGNPIFRGNLRPFLLPGAHASRDQLSRFQRGFESVVRIVGFAV